jgi:signal transduction histidine kinase
MTGMQSPSVQQDVDAVSGIAAVPRILDVVCQTTGLGFAAVARVTDQQWVCCSARDDIGFGLLPGGELKLETTICHEIRQHRQAVVIDDVQEDPQYAGHHTPAMYGFRSYISVPIVLPDGSFFGTLCGIDPRPAKLKNPTIVGMFELFAELIASHLDAHQRALASETALLDARQAAQLREQFIAVLGHDLRNPLQSLHMGTALLERAPDRLPGLLPVMQKSVQRMAELIENVMDFARGRLGGGLADVDRAAAPLGQDLEQVVQEARAIWPDRSIDYRSTLQGPVPADAKRIAQMLSNLLGNALKYGSREQPVEVRVETGAAGFVLSVANGGPAIPASIRANLFQPFVRTHGHSSPEGLGLGLYIVAEIARAHGGTVDVASVEGRTVFTFRMPLAATPA